MKRFLAVLGVIALIAIVAPFTLKYLHEDSKRRAEAVNGTVWNTTAEAKLTNNGQLLEVPVRMALNKAGQVINIKSTDTFRIDSDHDDFEKMVNAGIKSDFEITIICDPSQPEPAWFRFDMENRCRFQVATPARVY